MWYLCTINKYVAEFYSATKKNEILSFAGKWMELENIILSEISQVQKTKKHIFCHMWNIDLKYNNIMKKRSHKGEVTYERRRIKERN
jgi:hypothetical protein